MVAQIHPTSRHLSTQHCKKSVESRHMVSSLEFHLPPPHTRWTASHLISLNPVNFKYRIKLFHLKVVIFTTNLKSADEVSTVTLNCPSSLISFFVTVPPNSLFNIFIFRQVKCEKIDIISIEVITCNCII